MVEKAFFGTNHLPKINKMASIVMLNLDRRTSISTFQSRFLEENKKAKTPNNPELSLQRSKRGMRSKWRWPTVHSASLRLTSTRD